MKLIFIAFFASAIIAAQGLSATNTAPAVVIGPELIKKFVNAVIERIRLAMRPGTNGPYFQVMDPFVQDKVDFDMEKLKYVIVHD